jgi:hypothetical protein
MVKYGKIYPISFGFGWGVVSGLSFMLLCWAGARWGVGVPVISLAGTVYHHIEPTLMGGFWGLFWGFLHGLVFGIITALIYNNTTSWFCPAGSCDSCDSCK